jgi:hypothetical protein
MHNPSLTQIQAGGIRTALERLVRTLSPDSPSEAGGHLPPLQIGQIVTGKVIEALSAGRYLISVAGVPLEAMASPALEVGAELALQVDQLTPTLILRRLASGPDGTLDILHLLRTRLPNYVAVGEAIQALRQEWRDLAAQLPIAETFPQTARLHDVLLQLLPEGSVPDAEQLAAYLRDGGLFYEAKLLQQRAGPAADLVSIAEHDVKGLLLAALRELETASERSPGAGLAQAVRQHLDQIESQQALQLLARLHDAPLSLQIPVWLGQAFATVMLTVDRDGQGTHEGQGGAQGSYHVLFLLDLDGLGATRIAAQATAQALRVVFYVEQQAALPALCEALPELESALHSLGFPAVHVEARPLSSLAPDERQAFERRAVAVPGRVNLVDVKV